MVTSNNTYCSDGMARNLFLRTHETQAAQLCRFSSLNTQISHIQSHDALKSFERYFSFTFIGIILVLLILALVTLTHVKFLRKTASHYTRHAIALMETTASTCVTVHALR